MKKMMKMIIKVSLIAFFSAGGASFSWAADAETDEMAKSRTYTGGLDESDLKVQAVLPKNVKSKNETVIEDEGF